MTSGKVFYGPTNLNLRCSVASGELMFLEDLKKKMIVSYPQLNAEGGQ